MSVKVQGVVELERLRPLMFIEVLCKCVSGVMRNRHERGVVRMNLLSDMQWAYHAEGEEHEGTIASDEHGGRMGSAAQAGIVGCGV